MFIEKLSKKKQSILLLYREFKPAGNKNPFIYFWLPFAGMMFSFILLFLCICFSIGIYEGYSKKLKELSENPFSSSLLLKGKFNQKKIKKFNQLVWDKEEKKFKFNKESEAYISLVKKCIPFYECRFAIKDKDGFFDSTYGPKGCATDISNESIKKYINKQVEKANILEKRGWFSGENEEGIFISRSLWEKFGFDKDAPPRVLHIRRSEAAVESLKHVREKEYARPLDPKNQMILTFDMPFLGVAETLLHEDFIVSEKFKAHFSRAEPDYNKYHFERAVDAFKIALPENIITHKHYDLFAEDLKAGLKARKIRRKIKNGKTLLDVRLHEKVRLNEIKGLYYDIWDKHFGAAYGTPAYFFCEPVIDYDEYVRVHAVKDGDRENLSDLTYYKTYLQLKQEYNNIIFDNISSLKVTFEVEDKIDGSRTDLDFFHMKSLQIFTKETERVQTIFKIQWWIWSGICLLITFLMFFWWSNTRFHSFGIARIFHIPQIDVVIYLFLFIWLTLINSLIISVLFISLIASIFSSYFIGYLYYYPNWWWWAHPLSYCGILFITTTLSAAVIAFILVKRIIFNDFPMRLVSFRM